MRTPSDKQPRREPFLRTSDRHASETRWEEAILRFLISQDGSTTRLLESVVGGKITVHVLDQRLVQELPRELDSFLPGSSFLRRLTFLEARGHVLLDSLSYIAIEALPPSVIQELQEGNSPIGNMLSQLWTKRAFRTQDTFLFEELWHATASPDPQASRSCCIYTSRSPCMILGETFRRGVLTLLSERTGLLLDQGL